MKQKSNPFVVFAALASFAFTLGVFAPVRALAARGDTTNFASLRQDRADRKPSAAKLVRIEGALTCDLGLENTGKSCELRLHETGSDRIYNLIEASAAMRLYQDGNRNVMIEGQLAGTETISVKVARTL
jgi:hypothetical protein